MGLFPTAPTQKKLLLVATDYFSKWIEMSHDSSGRTLSAGSVSQDQSYPIMGRSLTAGSIETFAKS